MSDSPEEMIKYYEDRRRIYVVSFGYEDLHRILKLPEHVHVQDAHWDERRKSLIVTVHSSRFPIVPPYCEPPMLQNVQKIFEECEHGAVHVEVQFPE